MQTRGEKYTEKQEWLLEITKSKFTFNFNLPKEKKKKH